MIAKNLIFDFNFIVIFPEQRTEIEAFRCCEASKHLAKRLEESNKRTAADHPVERKIPVTTTARPTTM